MAWESRKGKGAYYTRSRRYGGRVVREYIGSDETAKVIAYLDAQKRQELSAKQDAQREVQNQFDAIDSQVELLCELADDLARAMLIVAGYHQHKGSEWRRFRERKPTDQIDRSNE